MTPRHAAELYLTAILTIEGEQGWFAAAGSEPEHGKLLMTNAAGEWIKFSRKMNGWYCTERPARLRELLTPWYS